MNFKKSTTIFILSLCLFSIVFVACCKTNPKTLPEEIFVSIENSMSENSVIDAQKRFPIPNEANDILLIMEELTGNKSIIKVNENININKLKEMLIMANSGEADSSGRLYFAHSYPFLRDAPATIPERRLDKEIFMAKEAGQLRRIHTMDIEINFIDSDKIENRHSFMHHKVVEIISETALIARKEEQLITYVVKDEENDDYKYGVFYIMSAIPVEAKNSTFTMGLKILGEDEQNSFSVIEEIDLSNTNYMEE